MCVFAGFGGCAVQTRAVSGREQVDAHAPRGLLGCSLGAPRTLLARFSMLLVGHAMLLVPPAMLLVGVVALSQLIHADGGGADE